MVIAIAMISATAEAVTYTGSISTPDGIVGSGPWGESFQVAWEISDNPVGQPTGSWLYQYWITDQYGQELGKEVSHFIIAISPNATSEDFWGNSYLEVGTFSGANPSNPGMPGSLYGLKVETPGGSHFQFYSSKSPVWGDGYFKDGKDDGVDVYAYNADFGDPDPTDPPQSGLLLDESGAPIYKILRPDSQTTMIPEPTTMILFGTGLAFAGGIIRRRRNS
jgi:hypothetical protein